MHVRTFSQPNPLPNQPPTQVSTSHTPSPCTPTCTGLPRSDLEQGRDVPQTHHSGAQRLALPLLYIHSGPQDQRPLSSLDRRGTYSR